MRIEDCPPSPGKIALPFGLEADPALHAITQREMPDVAKRIRALAGALDAALENEDMVLVTLTLCEIRRISQIFEETLPQIYPHRQLEGHHHDADCAEWANRQAQRALTALLGAMKLEEEGVETFDAAEVQRVLEEGARDE